jgi:dephospho-CoA kinase
LRLRVGLTGGIGSGKSEVAQMLRGLGALVIDADELAREAVAPGTPGLAQIAARWPSVVHAGGLDRPALAGIVFDDPHERAALNAIVHPIVRRLGSECEAAAGADQIVIHEIPLLFEAGFSAFCDENVVVIAPLEERLSRLLARGGLSREDIEARMAAQIDPELARERADYALLNDGSLDDLRLRTEALYRTLRNSGPAAG